VLRLRFADFERITRARTLNQPTASTETVLRAARELLQEALPTLHARGVTLVGVSVANLDDADRVQLAIPFDERPLDELDAALDAVRERFGATAITRATLLERGSGVELPLLPD
jgi:DNA polymerase-4